MRPALSVLDLAPVTTATTASDALRHSIELAPHVERLGYVRHWVAEHHNIPSVASVAPDVLMAHLAAVTSTIRIGSGGVMLPNHAPLAVAERFATLAALHPGRIDLGIGRAPGTDGATAAALRRPQDDPYADRFPEDLRDVRGFLGDGFPATHPFSRIQALPGGSDGPPPDVWLLGSSGYSAQLAGALGLPFAFAHHFAAQNTLAALELYHRSFTPGVLQEPYSMIGVVAVAAPDAEEARRLALPLGVSMARLRSGRPTAIPSPEEAAAHMAADPRVAEMVEAWLLDAVVGDPEQVRAGLEELAERTAVDELMLTTNVFEHADRMRSYELVAQAWPLAAAA